MNPEYEQTYVSRRDFLKLSGLGFLGLILPPIEDEEPLEDLESVSVDFEFVNHSSDLDIVGVRPKIEESELIIIENIGWDDEELDFFNNVSRGDANPEEILEKKYNSFYTQLLKELFGTNKKVVFADIPKYSGLETEWYTVRDSFLDFSKPFTQQLRELYLNFRMYADWQRRRENEVLKTTYKEIRRFKNAQENKLLATNVMVIYGAAHTRLMHVLKRDMESNFSFPNNKFVFSYEYEAKRRFWFADDDVDPKKVAYPDEDLMAHVVLEKIMNNYFYLSNEKYFSDTSELDSWFRGVVAKFDLQEIKSLWDERHMVLKKGDPKGRFVPKEMVLKIADMMREKGVDEKYVLAGVDSMS